MALYHKTQLHFSTLEKIKLYPHVCYELVLFTLLKKSIHNGSKMDKIRCFLSTSMFLIHSDTIVGNLLQTEV